MADDAALTIRLPADLRAAFMAACKDADLTASQVLRAAIREFVERRPQGSLALDGKARAKR